MADEFRDASRARARLCRALVGAPGRFFFAVGDDWQSINRVCRRTRVSDDAGFREWFGHGQVLKLETNSLGAPVRCATCPAGSCPRTLGRSPSAHSATSAQGPVLRATGEQEGPVGRCDRPVPGESGRGGARWLDPTAATARFRCWAATTPIGSMCRPIRDASTGGRPFLTIHRSKGSEADYVILPEMISTPCGRSFPNTRTDDPVLALAMPEGDTFPLGEERRLFYGGPDPKPGAPWRCSPPGANARRSSGNLRKTGPWCSPTPRAKPFKRRLARHASKACWCYAQDPMGEFRSCPSSRALPPAATARGGQPFPFTAQYADIRRGPAAVHHQAPRLAPAPKPTSPKRTLSSMLQNFSDDVAEISRDFDRAVVPCKARHRI